MTGTGKIKRIERDGFGIVEVADSAANGWFTFEDLKNSAELRHLKAGTEVRFEIANQDGANIHLVKVERAD